MQVVPYICIGWTVMIVKLIVSKKTYSIIGKTPITKWFEASYDWHSLKEIEDFDLRAVNAGLEGRSLVKEFKELEIDWSLENAIKSAAYALLEANRESLVGIVDICLFIQNYNLAVVVQGKLDYSNRMFQADSIKDLKDKLDSYE